VLERLGGGVQVIASSAHPEMLDGGTGVATVWHVQDGEIHGDIGGSCR
jgi:hypothetical protein